MVHLASQEKAAIQRLVICGKIQNIEINFTEWVITIALFKTLFQRFASRYASDNLRTTTAVLDRAPFQQPGVQIKMCARGLEPNVCL